MEVRSGLLPSLDGCALLGRVAALLAADGEPALPDALGLMVSELGLRSAVLRASGADGAPDALLAVAGEVMHAVPLSRRSRSRSSAPASAAVELPVSAAGRQVATLTVTGARPSQLPALRACSAVVGLRLDGRESAGAAAAAALLDAVDAEVTAVADALHDGPVQDLVVARYAADLAVATDDPARAREAVQSALVALRRTPWLLRPRGASEAGLEPALAALSAQLVAAGSPALLLDLEPDAVAALSAPAAAAAYRLVQSVATGPDPVRVRLTRRDGDLVLEVDGGQTSPSSGWTARALALGARLSSPPGRLLLAFPPRLEVAP